MTTMVRIICDSGRPIYVPHNMSGSCMPITNTTTWVEVGVAAHQPEVGTRCLTNRFRTSGVWLLLSILPPDGSNTITRQHAQPVKPRWNKLLVRCHTLSEVGYIRLWDRFRSGWAVPLRRFNHNHISVLETVMPSDSVSGLGAMVTTYPS